MIDLLILYLKEINMPPFRANKEELLKMYHENTDIKVIATHFGISRTAVYDYLKKANISPNRRSVETVNCKFCGEQFTRIGSQLKKKHGGYCSPQCFAASRSICGEYSKNGGVLSRVSETANIKYSRKQGMLARKAIEESGIQLSPGQVIHHIDGVKSNNDISNLMIFDSQSEHMKYHHNLRKKTI
jgi:hypothetical protein